MILGLLIAGLIAFFLGIARARAAANKFPEIKMHSRLGYKMHSRLGYYGAYCLIWTAIPAIILTLLWGAFSPNLVYRMVQAELPQSVQELSDAEQNLIMGRIGSIAEGVQKLSYEDKKILRGVRIGVSTVETAAEILRNNGVILGGLPEPYIIGLAYDQVVFKDWSRWLITVIAYVMAFIGFQFAYLSIQPRLPARNYVEGVIQIGLIMASTVAVLTTIGIVLSVVFESIRFFQYISLENFYLGTVWDPRFTSADANRGEGQFGFLPLLWGTIYISIVALLVAVPIGLYAAIYLSEYAGSKFRAVAKPLLEILAGIPTIVYGFFALITFGPMLRDAGDAVDPYVAYLGSLIGLDLGVDIAATSVLTAGIVMGIMIIPFVSSLSDDIISAVPQSLREGSYGLGATQSETIRRVILPAALPGIVGAVLLAASRAIGETMIVVLAAGIAANLTINPFESVTTITVKIVSQLTGDLEFNSPQTLVAFALGLTLFVITLILNIYALYIVRKYKEQYD
ncbi:MAG: phosphate ABC transporter permease subunit PstC [Pseudomonadota bacterium]